MKTLVIDTEQFDPVALVSTVTEAELLMLINVFLEETHCGCTVKALRHVDSEHRNWEVASLELEITNQEDANERLTHIGYLIGRMTDGYNVAWPSTLLH